MGFFLLQEVARFLNTKHENHYKVYDLCSTYTLNNGQANTSFINLYASIVQIYTLFIQKLPRLIYLYDICRPLYSFVLEWYIRFISSNVSFNSSEIARSRLSIGLQWSLHRWNSNEHVRYTLFPWKPIVSTPIVIYRWRCWYRVNVAGNESNLGIEEQRGIASRKCTFDPGWKPQYKVTLYDIQVRVPLVGYQKCTCASNIRLAQNWTLLMFALYA